jgi:hypothetical protein
LKTNGAKQGTPVIVKKWWIKGFNNNYPRRSWAPRNNLSISSSVVHGLPPGKIVCVMCFILAKAMNLILWGSPGIPKNSNWMVLSKIRKAVGK